MAPFGVEMINIYGKYLWKTYTYMGNNRYCDAQAVNGLYYRKYSNISGTLVGNEIVDNSDVVGASPFGAAPTTSSFSTLHLASMDWAKATARRDEKTRNIYVLWLGAPYIRELTVVIFIVSYSCFIMFCCGLVPTVPNKLPRSYFTGTIRQSHGCPRTSETILQNMGKHTILVHYKMMIYQQWRKAQQNPAYMI